MRKTCGDSDKPFGSSEESRVQVRVEILGHLRRFTGKNEFDVELVTPTIGGLIEQLSIIYGEEFVKEIVGSGPNDFQLIILVNGNDIDFLKKSETPLSSGDKVQMFPAVAGG